MAPFRHIDGAFGSCHRVGFFGNRGPGNIGSDFLHGNLKIAALKAGSWDYSVSNPDWATRIRLVEAEIPMYPGRRPERPEVIALLNSPGVP